MDTYDIVVIIYLWGSAVHTVASLTDCSPKDIFSSVIVSLGWFILLPAFAVKRYIIGK
jgi:hypothetical protein